MLCGLRLGRRKGRIGRYACSRLSLWCDSETRNSWEMREGWVMKHAIRIVLSTWVVLLTALPVLAASPYANNANMAVQWLSQHQNIDGSWGATDDVKLPCTVEAVLALQALNRQIGLLRGDHLHREPRGTEHRLYGPPHPCPLPSRRQRAVRSGNDTGRLRCSLHKPQPATTVGVS